MYLFFGYMQVQGETSIANFTGFIVLFIVTLIISLFCIKISEKKEYFLFTSYGFSLCNLLFIFMVINKYVFSAINFKFWIFLGELVFLIGGACLFILLYIYAEDGFRYEDNGD